ncbi:MAG: sporulation integral membrane protein YtvI [Clostridia bacterium]|nr:sporulation integral membrane protein YtvI [Clostridia bacterium]MBP3651257.1 sporulation integral membrane protein YtvI [Clostridia bacterium]
MEWTRQVKQWNCRLSGLPRKGLVITLVIALTAVLFIALPYIWPFVLALACSRLLEPFVRRMAGLLKPLHLGRRTATLLGMLLLFGVAGTLAGLLLSRLSQEFLAMVRTLPQLVVWITGTALPNLHALYDRYLALMPAYVPELLSKAIASLAQRAVGWAAALSGWLTTGAWSTALGIPHVLLALVLVAMGTYYLTADRERILRFWGRLLPASLRKYGMRVKEDVLRSIYGQLKSQLLLSLLIMGFLVLLFWIFRVPYGLVAGLGIGLMDALPVLGAGLFLVPWSLLSFIGGNTGTGILMAAAYFGTVIIRQVLEPRIVGRNLGLYPLVTMMAMYAGFRLFGVLGLIGGPVMMGVLRAVLKE